MLTRRFILVGAALIGGVAFAWVALAVETRLAPEIGRTATMAVIAGVTLAMLVALSWIRGGRERL